MSFEEPCSLAEFRKVDFEYAVLLCLDVSLIIWFIVSINLSLYILILIVLPMWHSLIGALDSGFQINFLHRSSVHCIGGKNRTLCFSCKESLCSTDYIFCHLHFFTDICILNPFSVLNIITAESQKSSGKYTHVALVLQPM